MPTPVGYADVSIHIKHDFDDREWMITYGFDVDLSVYSGQAYADDHKAQFFARWGGILTNRATVSKAVVRVGQDGGEDLAYTSQGPPLRGTNVAEKLPQNTALLIAKRTNLGGRKNRGRMYVPGMLQDSQVDDVGLIVTATHASYQDVTNTWLTDLRTGIGPNDTQGEMVVLHSDGSAPTTVTSLVVDQRIATQRRRLRR